MKPLKIIVGVILAMASMWLGCYFFAWLPNGHWALFPMGMTAIVGAAAGVYLFVDGAV